MRNESGFTILELMIVVSILGILGTVGAHSIGSSLPGKQLHGAMLVLRGELNKAKVQALKDGVQYRVSVAGNSYQFEKGNLSSGSTVWTATSTLKSSYPKITMSGGPFVFDPRGTASGATITLTNSRNVTRKIDVTIAGRIKSI